MTTLVKRPLDYIARGDFFKPKIVSALLHFINILPVYRREEGKELMYKNNETFSYCIELFKKNGALVIFSEGLSENKWELRPLRKGTARLAFEAWNNLEIGDRLKVVPVAIHYSSWKKIRPVATVEFLKSMERNAFDNLDEPGYFNKMFNEKLKERLSEKCIVINKIGDTGLQNKMIAFIIKNFTNGAAIAKSLQNRYSEQGNEKFKSNYNALSDFLTKNNINYDLKPGVGIMKWINLVGWFIVIVTAYIYNVIPYYISKFFVRATTKGNDFYDSLLYCMLMVIYPLYLILLFLITNCEVNYRAGVINVFLAAFSAYYYEASNRYIQSFFKRKELVVLHNMFNRLFEKDNG